MLVVLYQEGVRRREGAVDSSTLFLFWLLLVCCDVFPFQTILRAALRLVCTGMCVCVCVCVCVVAGGQTQQP